jgi:hypothetical protein
MSPGPTASRTGRRANDRRGPEPRRAPDRRGAESRRAPEVRIKRTAQEYERELRRQELAIGRSLTAVLPSDRPARIRELVEARRVMSGGVRDLQRLERDLRADLERYSAQRSHTQREVLDYEAVAGEFEEVLLRWEARREQLSATIERGNRRQGRPGAPQGQGRPGAPQGQGRQPRGQSRRAGGQERNHDRGAGGQERNQRRQGRGRRGGPGGRSSGGGGRPDPPRAG